MTQLAEQFRPGAWSQVVGQDKVVQRIQALARRGLGGRAYWLSGQSGTGKTTIARLIAGEVAGPLATNESNAQDATLDDIRAMETRFETRALSRAGEPSGRAFIFNEAHLLRKPVISRLLTTLEMIPAHVAIVFTVISDGQDVMFDDCVDAHPLLSRCLPLNLARRDLCEPFATVAVANCRAAGLLNGKPDAYYVKRAVAFLKSNKNNFRALYQAADAGYLTDADHDEATA
jgi:replication-associated recombination protein RarA